MYHGVGCILVCYLTSKSALLLFTLLSASKPHIRKRPVIGNLIKCSQTIQKEVLVILKSILRGRVIDIDSTKIFVILNNKICISAIVY